MLKLLTMLAVLLFAHQPVSAQGETPKLNVNFGGLSNCGNWELIYGWHFSDGSFKYEGKVAYLVDQHYECFNDAGYHMVQVFYRPVFEEELKKSNKDNENVLFESKSQWFLIYEFSPSDKTKDRLLLYEKSRKWYEFYRTWRPKWRFVVDWNMLKTGTAEDDFLSEKFGLSKAH